MIMKNTLFILAIFCSFLTFAQTTRSIEVKVKDTVELKLITSDVQLTLTQDYNEYEVDYYGDEYEGYDESDYYDYEADYYANQTKKEKRQEKKDSKRFEKEMKKMEEEMRQYEQSMPIIEEAVIDSTETAYPIELYEFLYMTFEERKAKWITFLTENTIAFDTTATETTDYSDYGSFNIQLNKLSSEKLDLVYQFTDSVENSYPSITATHHESIEPKMADVYADLYKKAQAEAAALAKVLGATPTKVIRVYEQEPVIDISNFGESYLDMINNLLEKGENNLKPESKKTYIERIFVFEIK
jgi:hypothetical protein